MRAYYLILAFTVGGNALQRLAFHFALLDEEECCDRGELQDFGRRRMPSMKGGVTMQKGIKDGTVELRSAIKTAFPQMTEEAIDKNVAEMREANRQNGGA